MANAVLEERKIEAQPVKAAPAPGKGPTPAKSTMNLFRKEKSEIRLSVVIPCVVLILIAAALFAKFAVIDRFAKLGELEAQLADEKATLDATKKSYADYNEVAEEYSRYNYTGYDKSIADRLDVLALLEREVFPMAGVESLSVSGKTLSMTLRGLTLEQVSELLQKLEADPLVAHVTVSTTGYGESVGTGEPRANMTVELADAGNPAETSEGGEG